MTVAPLARPVRLRPGVLAAALALALLNPLTASAQGSSRFDSMFDDARQFLDQQLKKLDDNLPQRGATRSTGVPVPKRNPRRPIELAEPESPQLKPVQPIQPPESVQEAVEQQIPTPPEPAQQAEPGPKGAREADKRAVVKQPEPAPPKPAKAEQPSGAAETPSAKAPDPAERPEPEASASTAEEGEVTPPELPQESSEAAETASAEPTPDVPIRNPARTGEYKPPPPHPSEIEAPDWTEKQIAEAKAQCDKLLSEEILKFEKLDPIRTGICGTPAPVKLTSLEAGSTVEIAPAATLTCPLAAALRRWMKDVVQPAAKQHLGSHIASIRNVASYACRNRYGGARRPLSEHAKVNAIDIAAFKTESGETVVLLQHWNLMIEPEPPVAPAEPEDSADKDSDSTRLANDGDSANETEKAAAPDDAKDRQASAPAEKTTDSKQEANSGDGGDEKPKDEEPPVPVAKPKPHPKSLFLRAIRDGACGIFGTVLGPESNAAHRDHFHFDAAERRKSYCE